MKVNNRRWKWLGVLMIFGVVMYIIMVVGTISTAYHNEEETLTPIEIHDEEYLCPDVMLYDYTIDFIKRCEGYMPERYLCPTSKVTIGYGHRIYKDTITWLTENQADSLLRADFDFYMDWVGSYYKDIEYNKQIALAHFAFCCGEGALKNMYENQCIYNALKYYHYRDMNGNVIKSEYMEIIRKFNVDMYNEHIFE